jgi:hypothetical protein
MVCAQRITPTPPFLPNGRPEARAQRGLLGIVRRNDVSANGQDDKGAEDERWNERQALQDHPGIPLMLGQFDGIGNVSRRQWPTSLSRLESNTRIEVGIEDIDPEIHGNDDHRSG